MKKIQSSFKEIMIFSHVFLPILYNIMLYIYTERYIFGIKISGFLLNIFLKNLKTFKLISPLKKKNILFSCIHSNSKTFSKHVFIKKNCIFLMF
jgi:hypothetical protein